MLLKQIIEQAQIIDNHHGQDFEMDYKQEKSTLKLLKDNIPPFNLKAFQGNDIFYLTDKNDGYLGHIEYENFHTKCNAIKFNSSYSKQRGFYKILFEVVFVKTDIECIFGDSKQTKRAISAWKKMLKKYQPIVLNTKTNEFEIFKDYNDFNEKNNEHKFWATYPNDYLIGVSKIGMTENKLENYLFDFLNEKLNYHRKHPRSGHKQDMLIRGWDLTEDEADELIEFFGEKK